MKRLCWLASFSLLLTSAFGQRPIRCASIFTSQDSRSQAMGSTYVPLDSWIYPAMDRLHALGQVDTAFLGLRPWTRLSILHMLEAGSEEISATAPDSDACAIYHSIQRELKPDSDRAAG